MFEGDDACLELGEIGEAFGCCQTVRPFHFEDVLTCRCVESCDESRDAIAAFEKPNHVLLIGLTVKDGQTVGGVRSSNQLIYRRRWEPGAPIVLSHGFAAFRDRPGLAARRTADIDNRAPERISLGRHRVAPGARKKASGLAGIHWPFVHDNSTMP